MPNWCDNTLTIEGAAEDIDRIVAELATPPLDTDGQPDSTPTELHLGAMASPWETDDEKTAYFSGTDAWYDLRIRYWGTKWAVEADREDVAPTIVSYRFSSAWTPPMQAVTTYAAANPTATFTLEYNESGNDFAGRFTVKGTEVLENIQQEGLTYWCDVCEEATECQLGEERTCYYTTLPDDSEASMRHLLDGGATLNEFLDMVTSPEMNRAMHVTFDKWLCSTVPETGVLPPMPERAAVLADVGADVAPWCAHLLLTGLTDNDIDAIIGSDNPTVAQIGRIGTAGYALWRGYDH